MQQARHDIYSEIHKGLRQALCEWVGRFGRLDVTEHEAIEKTKSDFASFSELMQMHATHEETWVHPLLNATSTGLVEKLEADHGELEAIFSEVNALLTSLPMEDIGKAWETQFQIYRLYSRYCSRYLAHMDQEEMEANLALWESQTDEELRSLTANIRGSVEPAQMAEFLTIMIPAMHFGEHVGFFSDMKANAPEEAYLGVCAMAKNLIGEPAMDRVLSKVA